MASATAASRKWWWEVWAEELRADVIDVKSRRSFD
jgi:hypothetical protein